MLHSIIFTTNLDDDTDKYIGCLKALEFKMPNTEPQSYKASEIIDMIKKGYMYCVGTLRKEQRVQQSIFAIDVDASVSFLKLKELFDANRIHIFFAYKTYSSEDTDVKVIRILFAFNKSYSSMYADRIYKALTLLINDTFSNAVDTDSLDNTRLLFPCFNESNILYEDPNAIMYLFQIHDIYQSLLNRNLNYSPSLMSIKRSLNGLVTLSNNTKSKLFRSILVVTENLFILKDIRIKKRYTDQYKYNFTITTMDHKLRYDSIDTKTIRKDCVSHKQENATKRLMDYVYGINLRRILDLKTNNFSRLFGSYDETNDNISIEKKSNVYYLRCQKKRLTLIDIVQKLLQETADRFIVHPIDAYYWVLNELHITNDNLRLRLNNAEEYKNFVNDKTKVPAILFKRLTRGSGIHLSLFNYLLDNALSYGYKSNRFGVPYLYFTVSLRYLTNHIDKNKMYTYSSIHNSVKFLNELGLIESVPDEELSEYLQKKLKVGDYKNRISLFRIPLFSNQLIESAVSVLTGDKIASVKLFEKNTFDSSLEDAVYDFVQAHIRTKRYVTIQNLIKYVKSLKSCSTTTARNYINRILKNVESKCHTKLRVFKKSLAKKFRIPDDEHLNFGTSKLLCLRYLNLDKYFEEHDVHFSFI